MTKLTRLREQMQARGMDAFICLDELNQKYLSGFAFTDGYLAVTAEEAYLVTDFRYTEDAEVKADPSFRVIAPDNRTEWLSKLFAAADVRTVGMEGKSVPYAVYLGYEERHEGITFVDVGDMVEQLRQVKTEEELALMQRAQDITDRAFSHILKVLTPEMTELEVAAELEYAMRKLGASGLAFDTIAVSGDASSMPHGVPRSCKLKAGFLTMDFGAKFDGWCSDMTRTVVIGKADANMRALYDTVLRAQRAVLDAIGPAADAGEMDKIARDIIDADPAFRGAFGHGLGHSVGLFIHEAPALNRRAFGRALRPGEILTVEPGIYLPGKYGCRIEDMIAITEDGIHNFTHSPKELIEIF